MRIPYSYKRLGYVSLGVSNAVTSGEFYSKVVGLELVSGDARRQYLRCSNKPFDLLLETDENVGLKRVGFELQGQADVERAFAHLENQGLAPRLLEDAELEEIRATAAIRVADPATGLQVELFADQTVSGAPFKPTLTNIARLGHVVLNVESYARASEFWVDKLGFVISDHVPGKIAFLRCFPNPLHHTFALLEGSSNGLNHVNFMVSDIDDIGCALNRFKKHDVPIVFGPGRHLPSTSIFLYFLDPDGMTAEYSFGMEEFPVHESREPRELEPVPEVLDTWGSIPDPRFGKTGEILGSNKS